MVRMQKTSWISCFLIFDLVGLRDPLAKDGLGLVTHQRSQGKLSIAVYAADLGVKVLVVKPCFRSVIACSGKKYRVRPRPEDRTEAHRARFARRVNGTSCKLECAQPPARCANRHDLRVRGRIVGRRHAVVALAYDLGILRDDAAKRPTGIILHAFASKLDRPLHHFFVNVGH